MHLSHLFKITPDAFIPPCSSSALSKSEFGFSFSPSIFSILLVRQDDQFLGPSFPQCESRPSEIGSGSFPPFVSHLYDPPLLLALFIHEEPEEDVPPLPNFLSAFPSSLVLTLPPRFFFSPPMPLRTEMAAATRESVYVPESPLTPFFLPRCFPPVPVTCHPTRGMCSVDLARVQTAPAPSRWKGPPSIQGVIFMRDGDPCSLSQERFVPGMRCRVPSF